MEWLVFLGVVLWLSATAALWMKVAVLERRLEECAHELDDGRAALAKMQEEMGALAGDGVPRHGERLTAIAAPGPSASLNFSRRVQVLRLHRRGESVSHIAATLGLSGAEAELMIKLHSPGLTVGSTE